MKKKFLMNAMRKMKIITLAIACVLLLLLYIYPKVWVCVFVCVCLWFLIFFANYFTFQIYQVENKFKK